MNNKNGSGYFIKIPWLSNLRFLMTCPIENNASFIKKYPTDFVRSHKLSIVDANGKIDEFGYPLNLRVSSDNDNKNT